ncbi:hypothetical protein NDU88_004456 [Pleurodeles waltl]|uniref:Peptidase A2 domain-containing protein n=1 Tax=Pleurodeles waltl TaxID=8319 RepID=A0AAV7SIU5_PLEWA|nr:hypothetical protein NDU88_004456 [Pleurodeles waltl]
MSGSWKRMFEMWKVGTFARVCKDFKKSNYVAKGKMACVSSGKDGHDWLKGNNEQKGMVLSLKHGDEIRCEQIKRPRCEVQIAGRRLELMADSGSPWTIVTQDYFKQVFEGIWDLTDLKEPDIIAESFEGRTIDVTGFVETGITFKERRANIKLYVAVKGVNVLGWRDQGKLGVILNPRCSEPVLVIESREATEWITSKFPQVFTSKLGKLINYSHRIKVKANAKPVIQKLRNVPISVRDELKKILSEIVNEGVIEEIESSEWVSLIVLA